MELPKETKLIEAVSNGNIEKVKEILMSNEFSKDSLELVDQDGDTPLQIACIKGYTEIAEILVDVGADVNTRNPKRFGYTPLHLAAVYNHLDVVKLLIEVGDANPLIRSTISNITSEEYYGKALELMQSAFARIGATGVEPTEDPESIQRHTRYVMRELIANGISGVLPLQDGDAGGFTPLHLASRCNCLGVIKYLLSLGGINPNVQDNSGHTSLHFAIYGSNGEIFEELLKAGADPSIKDREGKSPIDLIIDGGYVEKTVFTQAFKEFFPSFQILAKRCIWNNNVNVLGLPKGLFV